MKRLQTAVRALARDDTPETIAAAEAEAREAGAEAARQAEIAEAELEDRKAEAALARSRAEDRRRRRAEGRVAELRGQLAEAQWRANERAFRQHRRKLAELSRKVIAALEAAAQANAELAAAWVHGQSGLRYAPFSVNGHYASFEGPGSCHRDTRYRKHAPIQKPAADNLYARMMNVIWQPEAKIPST